ncbi:phage tail tape measure protein [Methylopila sp. M107]|uniref:phage tail tape measure protein n=1 Tax=Methylopila sp. M107 TaxID=1101190 RepID=UPI00035D4DF8|nr:phage tail tape measure protein [Methylopila sp. M107]
MTDLDVALRLRLLNQLSGPAKVAEKDLAGLKNSVKGLDGAKGGERLAGNLRRVGDSAGKAGRSVRDLTSAAGRLDQSEGGRGLARWLDAVRRKAGEASSALQKVRRPDGGAPAGVSMSRGQADKAGLDIMLPRGTIGGLIGGAAAYQGVKQTVGAAISIEKSLAEVRKFYDLNDKQLSETKAEIFGLVTQMGKSPEAIAEIYASAGRQGIPREEVRGYAADVAKIAVAWDTAEGETADAIGKLKSIFGFDQQGVRRIAGAINEVADGLQGPVSERGLLDFLGNAGSTGAGVKLAAKEIVAFGGALASMGMEPSKAANAFNALIGKLSDAKGLSKDAKAEVKKLGLNVAALETDVKTDALKTLLDVIDRLGASKDPIKATNEIFGLEYGNEIRDLVNVRAQLRNALSLVRGEDAGIGGLDKAFSIKSATTDAQIERFKANLKQTSDAVAGSSLPLINEGLDRLNTALGVVRQNGDAFDPLQAGLRGLLDAIDRTPGEIETLKNFWTALRGEGQEKKQAGANLKTAVQDRSVSLENGNVLDRAESAFWAWGSTDDEMAAARRRRDGAKANKRVQDVFSSVGVADKAQIPVQPKVDPAALQRLQQMLSMPLDGAAVKAMAGYDAAITAEGQKAIGSAQQISDQLRSILSFHATPTISPRFTAPSIGGGATPAAPAGGATGKQSSLPHGGEKVAITQNFNHASPRAAARAAQREQNRSIRMAKARALHDLGSPLA